MIRLSSNWTMFFKLFIPTFFGVFYGLLSIMLLFKTNTFGSDNQWMAYSNFLFFLGMMFIFYHSVWRLVRVEADEKMVYVSNYFKTYRYPIDAIDGIEFTSSLIFKRALLKLKSKGTLGQHLPFLIHRAGIDTIVETAHPLKGKFILN